MKTIQGTIVSLKNAQTASVLIEWQWLHPVYKKYVKRSKKFACHFTDLKLAEGDTVIIAECRPVSKTKHYAVVSKVE